MNIVIAPQTPEQFDRLLAFLERCEAAYAERQTVKDGHIARLAVVLEDVARSIQASTK